RAVIGRDYTFDNLTIVARATAQWLQKSYGAAPHAVIGHDTRFMGRQFTEHVARVLAAAGVQVTMAETPTTTPAISWAAKAYGADAGIVITASHNPPEYNGFKIKANFGGPASPEQIAAVEAEMDDLSSGFPTPKAYAAYVEEGHITERDITAEYLDLLRERLDVEAIRASGIRLAHDAMYGVGQGLIRRLLGAEQVVELHATLNPGMMGQAPEPIEKNLGALAETVVREGCAAGLANDGDADRIGMYDETGT